MTPRKRKPPEPVELANLPPAPLPVPVAGLPLSASAERRAERVDEELDDVMLQLGGEAVVKVARVNMETGARAHCGDLPGEGFTLDTLADAFGGGRYWVRVMVGKVCEWKGNVEIDQAIPAKNPRGSRAAVAPGGAAAPSGNMALDQITAAMSAMMMASANNAQMMQQMSASQSQSMMTMLTAITTALAGRREADPMEMLRTAAELFRVNGGGGGDVEKMMGMLKEGLELGKMVGGGGDDASIPALIGKGLDAVSTIVRNGAQPPAAVPALPPGPQLVREVPQPPRVMLPPVPAPRPEHAERILENPDVPAPSEENTNVRLWVREATKHAGQLRMLASIGVNPETAVDMIVKGAAQEMWDDVCAYHDEAPSTFAARAVADFPLLGELGEWGGAVVEELRQAITEAAEEEEGAADAT